jgi:hypothetical protein
LPHLDSLEEIGRFPPLFVCSRNVNRTKPDKRTKPMTTDSMQEPTADLLYGVPRIAEFLGLTPAAVYHLAAQKRIPTFKIGKVVCARRGRLIAVLDALEAKGEAVTPKSLEP